MSGRVHPFDRMCRLLGVEHRLTKPYHPWTNGQAERMVPTLKQATVRAFHYDGIRELRRHVADSLAAYNFAKHLKALRWRTPYETLEALWTSRPELFHRSPDHLTLANERSYAAWLWSGLSVADVGIAVAHFLPVEIRAPTLSLTLGTVFVPACVALIAFGTWHCGVARRRRRVGTRGWWRRRWSTSSPRSSPRSCCPCWSCVIGARTRSVPARPDHALTRSPSTS